MYVQTNKEFKVNITVYQISGYSCILVCRIYSNPNTVKTQAEKPALPGQRGSIIRVMLHLLSKRLNCHRITMNKIGNQGRRFIFGLYQRKWGRKHYTSSVQFVRETTLVGVVVFFYFANLSYTNIKYFPLFLQFKYLFSLRSRLRIWRERLTYYMHSNLDPFLICTR